MDAIKKIEAEYNSGKAKLSQKGKAVGSLVVRSLSDFCKQNSEFARAIEQTKKDACKCIEHSVHNSGSAISDLDVCNNAANFYFPGAKVHMTMTLDLGDGGFSNDGSAASEISTTDIPESTATAQSSGKTLELSLDDLFD